MNTFLPLPRGQIPLLQNDVTQTGHGFTSQPGRTKFILLGPVAGKLDRITFIEKEEVVGLKIICGFQKA
jgi:hypothetical protein